MRRSEAIGVEPRSACRFSVYHCTIIGVRKSPASWISISVMASGISFSVVPGVAEAKCRKRIEEVLLKRPDFSQEWVLCHQHLEGQWPEIVLPFLPSFSINSPPRTHTSTLRRLVNSLISRTRPPRVNPSLSARESRTTTRSMTYYVPSSADIHPPLPPLSSSRIDRSKTPASSPSSSSSYRIISLPPLFLLPRPIRLRRLRSATTRSSRRRPTIRTPVPERRILRRGLLVLRGARERRVGMVFGSLVRRRRVVRSMGDLAAGGGVVGRAAVGMVRDRKSVV